VSEQKQSDDAVRSFELVQGNRLSRAQKNEARLFALSVVRDPTYRQNLLRDARARKLAPALEITIMAYAWGKPADKLEISLPQAELQELTNEQLLSRVREIGEALESGAASEAAIAEGIAAAEQRTDYEANVAKEAVARALAHRSIVAQQAEPPEDAA
jgi:hypothetical protein